MNIAREGKNGMRMMLFGEQGKTCELPDRKPAVFLIAGVIAFDFRMFFGKVGSSITLNCGTSMFVSGSKDL